MSKRILGYLSWQRKRRAIHTEAVLEAVRRDIVEQAPDHLCITGDLTNLGLAEECERATSWLEELADAERISVVPGNHDAYVKEAERGIPQTYRRWMGGEDRNLRETNIKTSWPDLFGPSMPGFCHSDHPDKPGDDASFHVRRSTDSEFPFLHQRGKVSFIGLSSAVATPPFFASGEIGEEQCRRLEAMLADLPAHSELVVLMLHHPPMRGPAPRRKALSDPARLQTTLRRALPLPAIILHGHMHHPSYHHLDCGRYRVPVLGCGSASSNGAGGSYPAHYHLFTYDDDPHTLHLTHRQYDPERGGVGTHGEGQMIRLSDIGTSAKGIKNDKGFIP